MATGSVKFYNMTKRFGFVSQDEGEDLFVHETGISEGPIADNDQVEFDIEECPKGLKAVNAKKI